MAAAGVLTASSAFAAYGATGDATIYGQMPNVCQVEVTASTSAVSKLDLSDARNGDAVGDKVFDVSEKCTDADGYTVTFNTTTAGAAANQGRLIHGDYDSGAIDAKHYLDYSLKYGTSESSNTAVNKLDGTANDLTAATSVPAGTVRSAYISHATGSDRLMEGDFTDTVTISIAGVVG